MADAYIGEIRVFAGNFAPKGWALCNGQLMSIQQNTALYSILGVQYGGDGKTTFALPNLIGAAPMNQGQGVGLTARQVGQVVGASSVTLMTTQIPVHTHAPMAIQGVGTSGNPTERLWAEGAGVGRPPVKPPLYDTNVNVPMNLQALGLTGGSQPHNNMQPFLVMNYIICLDGEFPPRG
ncbi:phage tail protein [Lysinibacillus piscis]|uniref:Tail Collar domain-containing protein n=1 Tax=Lysinibacillus piscis TaxID=2518931 RepID=A0ABQ5NFV2_9BACI|nr:tail fiber protein [Lysinibacillus sp. KH24]GLC86988.1 tail Collar domain-containing protein [Lysinibacillus sp. KH24]